ncbi:MAG: cytochrome c oxidase subunit II [Gammaproteobacteria bacterium]|nr:cytochrome c oxidase subunit II [Gammaproteobacteria bacterium]MBK9426008.1 cytochrome c oxidase subunit II [Gammaproteobacteria bacterium]
MVSKAKQLVRGGIGALALLPWLHAAAAEPAARPESWNLLNMPKGVTSVSQNVYDIHMVVIWICVWIGVAVFGVMFYSMFAHRKSRGHKPANFHESTKVELAWTIIPALILIVMAFPATTSLKHLYDTSEADLDVKITGYQWKWKYDYLGKDVSFISELATSQASIYGSAPKTEFYLEEVTEPLVIPVGKKVRLLMTGADVIHSWWVPELAVKRDAIPGFVNETWARVDKPGIYRGRCAELCGKDHAFMPIVVNAVPEEEFNAWLAKKQSETVALRALTEKTFTQDELMAKGEAVYGRTCAGCHGAAGEGVPGVFPAIKGSKIALGPVADHLAIVVNGKSGTAMQAFGAQLSEVDLAAAITYQRNAWGNKSVDNIVQPVDVFKVKNGQ